MLKRKKPPKKSLLKKGSNLSLSSGANVDTTQSNIYCTVDSSTGTTTTAVTHHGAVSGRRLSGANSRPACRASSRNANVVTMVTSSGSRNSSSQSTTNTSSSRTSTFHSPRNASASNAPPATGGQHQQSRFAPSVNSRTNLTIAPPTLLSPPDLGCPVAMATGSGTFAISVNSDWMALPSLPRSSTVSTATTGQGAGFGSNVEMGFAPPPRSAPASTGGRSGASARQKFFGGKRRYLTFM